MAHYLDTSALVKLIVNEPETEALRTWLASADRAPMACDLVRTELMRAVRRAAPDRLLEVTKVLDGITIVEVPIATFDQAGRLEPIALRSLDAIHLAAALVLGPELEGIVTYDDRLADAARSNGVPVTAPA